MGCVINSVAFPVPQLPQHFYESLLLRRSDLIWIETSQGERIPACYVRAPKPPDDEGNGMKMTLLYSHGNAEDIGQHLDYIDALSLHTGADVLSYEYLGYSLSRLEGSEASEAGCLRSIDAAWRYCVDKMGIPPNQIVIYGRSIGSGPSVDLASRDVVEGCSGSPKDARGVLLQSPLESGARAVFGSVASFVGYPLDIFRNYEKIGKITAPVAIMHGPLNLSGSRGMGTITCHRTSAFGMPEVSSSICRRNVPGQAAAIVAIAFQMEVPCMTNREERLFVSSAECSSSFNTQRWAM